MGFMFFWCVVVFDCNFIVGFFVFIFDLMDLDFFMYFVYDLIVMGNKVNFLVIGYMFGGYGLCIGYW